MSNEAPHLQIIIDGITHVDSVVEGLELTTDINGDITLAAIGANLDNS